MVMVTGIMRGAAVGAITTVGTEAADIIMDGTGADIAGIDNIHHIQLGRPPHGAALIFVACSSASETCVAASSVAAARAAAVRSPSVMSPRSAHLRIFLAICRRTRCSSAPIERPLHARSRATSILASVRESKLSAIMTGFFIELQQSLQA